MAILVCENLNYLYNVGTPFETAAIENIYFSADKSEIIGIIGHTGSGKSTLIQHFNGLVKGKQKADSQCALCRRSLFSVSGVSNF